MIENNDHPLAGISPTGLKLFDASTHFGRLLRQADAKQQLQQLDFQQRDLNAELLRISQIEYRLQRITNIAQLNIQHLLMVGVSLAEREDYRNMLHEVATSGERTLCEVAEATRSRVRAISECIHG